MQMVYPTGFTISHQTNEMCLLDLLVSYINQTQGIEPHIFRVKQEYQP